MNMECFAWLMRPTGLIFILMSSFPVSAMEAGADLAAVSMHKSGGSLTQSSLLLAGPAVSRRVCAADY